VAPTLIVTNQMFNCSPRPDLSVYTDKDLARLIRDLELRGDDCADQLALVKNHLHVNGVVITDVLVTGEKKEPSLLEKVFGSKSEQP